MTTDATKDIGALLRERVLAWFRHDARHGDDGCVQRIDALIAWHRADAAVEEHQVTADHREAEKWGGVHGCGRCLELRAHRDALTQQYSEEQPDA